MSNRLTLMAHGIVMVLLAVLFVATLPLTGDARELWLKEWGIVEMASALGYAASILLLIFRRHALSLWPFTVMITFFMLRELDLDKQFTTMGIFKSRFYISPETGLLEKLAGGAVLLGLMVTGIVILRRYTRPFLTGLRTGSAVACWPLRVWWRPNPWTACRASWMPWGSTWANRPPCTPVPSRRCWNLGPPSSSSWP
ncbi:hypothetical protein [Ectothiorhodospira mobilis]|uniref:hypothetical protein n=1 Tax=Ectothiorhodospira mobilis TaxID=195064 RepID=UPI001908036D|nr:hypothetical protein [Ectothiorhodospira mobilis]MBK1692658.1 hypothetical protein [Ectothiorhodospira mobilis]